MSDYDDMLRNSEANARAENQRRTRDAAAAAQTERDRRDGVSAKIEELVMPELQRAKEAFEAGGRYVEIRHHEANTQSPFPWVEFQVGHRPDAARLDIKDHSDCYAIFSWSSGRVVGWYTKNNNSVTRPNEGEFIGGRTDADTLKEGIKRTLDGNTRRRQQMGLPIG